ncbi:MAG TPA: YeeE/YedE family protein [Beijerinckiaceae bacterium]|nr:YeeE/YedE family protein [Beijerinckiaceae bacterium]
MTSFTPISALLGGALIGSAAVMLLLLNGRVAGISGIVGGLLRPKSGDTAWRVSFIGGLLSAPIVFALVAGVQPPFDLRASLSALVVGGLLVGFGTRLGGGCTSGHGVCGVARLSPRSLVATGAFMVAGFVTVFVLRHMIGV